MAILALDTFWGAKFQSLTIIMKFYGSALDLTSVDIWQLHSCSVKYVQKHSEHIYYFIYYVLYIILFNIQLQCNHHIKYLSSMTHDAQCKYNCEISQKFYCCLDFNFYLTTIPCPTIGNPIILLTFKLP